jgi:hypothetical protein
MLSRRTFIAGIAFGVAQPGRIAGQEKQKPREEELKTVTLTIDGMT